ARARLPELPGPPPRAGGATGDRRLGDGPPRRSPAPRHARPRGQSRRLRLRGARPGAAEERAAQRPDRLMSESRGRVWAEALGMWAVTAVAIRLAVMFLGPDGVSIVKCVALIYLPLAWILRTRRDPSDFGLNLD